MKYETPTVTALTPAISAIQAPHISKRDPSDEDTTLVNGLLAAYSDWE